MWLAHSPRPACLPNAAEHEYDALRIAIPLYMLRGELSQSEDSDENSFIESAWTGDRLRRTELVECSVERADTEPAKDISEPILDRDSFLIPFFKIFNLFRREDVVLVVCCVGCVLREIRRVRKFLSMGVGGSKAGEESKVKSN